MTGDQHDIVTILVKYALHQPLTQGEEDALAQWRKRSEEHAVLPDQFRDRRWLEEQQRQLQPPPTEDMWEDIRQYINEEGAPAPVVLLRTKRRIGLVWYPVAVLLLAGIVFGGMRWAPTRQPKVQIGRMNLPIRYKALLALDDGSLILLDTLKKGAIITSGPVGIRKADSNSYIYTAGVLPEGPIRHRLTIAPGAGIYRIQWPDGSQAWLRSGASLDYAIDWRSAEVKLEGEAWFKVAPNAGRPATISLPDGALVRVLGTSFDALGDATDNKNRVALFSGTVRVVKGSDSLLLLPGSQAVIAAQKIETGRVNNDSVLAWMRPVVQHSYFDFRDADLLQMLPEIASWYRVQVVNPQHLAGVGIRGQFPRTIPLAVLIEEIKSIEEPHVKIELRADTIWIAPLRAGD
jgi:transmembrane sensor